MRGSTLVLLGLFATILISHAQSAGQSSGQSSSRAEATKTWTNENISDLHGGLATTTNGSAKNARKPAEYPRSADGVTIVYPEPGTVFHPGDWIAIEAGVDSRVTVVQMFAGSAMGFGDQLKEKAPWSFGLRVPTDERGMGVPLLGEQTLGVMARESNGKEVQVGVMVDIEEWGPPKSISARLGGGSFMEVGGQDSLNPVGMFADGLMLDLSSSKHISYTSSDEHVVTIDDNGELTAIGKGSAVIHVTYTDREEVVRYASAITVTPADAPR